jgi:hypothetical protein
MEMKTRGSGVMIRLRWFAVAGVAALSVAPAWVSNAWVTNVWVTNVWVTNVWVTSAWVPYAKAQEPPRAIYCRGPLSTFRTDGGKVVKTPFKWAKEAAMKENPGAGECAWADRAPQGNEKPGETSTIVGNMGPFDNIPVGTIGKICVTKASGDSKDLVVKQIVRQLGHQTAPFHIPPFTADGC